MASQTQAFGAQTGVSPTLSAFNFGDAMNLTFSTLKARFWHMFGLFLCTVPLIALLGAVLFGSIASMGALTTPGATPSAGAVGGFLGGMLLFYIGFFVVDAWSRSALLVSALSHQAGMPTSFGSSVGRGFKHTPMVFLISLFAFIVYILCYMIGYIILIAGIAGGAASNNGAVAAVAGVIGVILMFGGAVPAFWLWCKWYVNTAARVAEGTGVFASFRRSTELTMGHKWSVAGHWLVILAIFMIIYFIVYAVLIAMFAGAFMTAMSGGINPNDPNAVLGMYGSMFSSLGLVGGIFLGIIYVFLLFLFVAIPACSYAACYTLLQRGKEGDATVADVFA
jgi:hypothetical protein